MADEITAINNKIISTVTSVDFMNIIGWLFFFLILIGGGIYGYIIWNNKRLFNKKATILEIVGTNYVPSMTDMMKVVKIGTGGFEILYFKKLKCYRIGYGGRVGKRDYYFFINKDGYWYNGMLSCDINTIDKNGGLIPVVTTNPNMRGQYTSLEKQIDTLHSEKKGFMEKYGMWVLGAGFIMIIGVFAWLIFREMSPIMSSASMVTDKQVQLLDRIDLLISHLGVVNSSAGSGLVPA